MKFAERVAEQVIWTASDHMAYYNLPPYMIQHWTYVHELNETLKDLVKFLAVGHTAANRPLNPKVAPCVYKRSEVRNVSKTNNDNNKRSMPSHQSEEEWIEVTNGIKIKNQLNACQHAQNRYDVLAEGEDEISNDKEDPQPRTQPTQKVKVEECSYDITDVDMETLLDEIEKYKEKEKEMKQQLEKTTECVLCIEQNWNHQLNVSEGFFKRKKKAR